MIVQTKNLLKTRDWEGEPADPCAGFKTMTRCYYRIRDQTQKLIEP